MPYHKINDLPPSVQRVLPKEAQRLFVKAFNSAFTTHHGDEAIAFKVAWAVVKKGYYKSQRGRWVKRKG
ncbi:MAG: ChaB family protein [Parachlamydiales bacterium]|jgi:cation transport regulator